MPIQPSDNVHAVRRAMWAADFRPVPVETDGKAPFGKNWPEAARSDQVFCVVNPPVPHMLNTGLLCDGLRVIDIDIDVAEIASQVRALLLARLGPAPIRYREGSPRCALIYRAARGSPRKVTLAGTHGKVEVLGHGQQLVVHGRHPTGAVLEWLPQPPWAQPLAALTEVTEETLAAVLAEVAPLLGATVTPELPHRGNGATHWPHTAEEERVAAALAALANDAPADWDYWVKVGMAAYAATEGSEAGFAAWDGWSGKHPDYDADATAERWAHFRRSPPSQVGAHTLFWLAGSTFRGNGAERHEPPPEDRWPEAEPEPPPKPRAGRIMTGEAFVNRHTPPDWLIDGLIQKGRLYACTSLTGHGKTAVWGLAACMIHAGRRFGSLEVTKGHVIYLAGENPTDLEARLIGIINTYQIEPSQLPFVLPATFPMTDDECDALKKEIDALGVYVALIVGDTAASFFPGDDENDNVQAGAYARRLRSLTQLPGNPAIVVLSHPIKNAASDNLLPRGGGAFLNELDGNLALWSAEVGEITQLRDGGKLRGPPFNPLDFRLRHVETGLRDAKDRPEITVVAVPISEDEAANQAKQTVTEENAVLRALHDSPGIAMADIAVKAGWITPTGLPEKWRVQRLIRSLATQKLISQPRKGMPWEINDLGRKAAGIPE